MRVPGFSLPTRHDGSGQRLFLVAIMPAVQEGSCQLDLSGAARTAFQVPVMPQDWG